ncbi:DUF3300 domain-containing protein [Cellvibrio japonicus]|uniref:Putative lipoprotein n=1 Tax=Cellvibrio japonicus (strain Ueda107) TaxID=498211 RepID=B3PCV4_CELJU|nr:DUF3300 domain-containing protein [Cellvibrio japonicus]ACE83228.1 putative lipoprotein [Cellvibrio japonicus Ueda107]QEI11902.1 DUF3300 domain-containing protein [Cellvibrio japonicus]QEI15476.1 DUF3300 domain-containing protein [Cellvibrio japonicus]QEI19055.1 DUF3300 domain-containing protein [Cellvibrio japonicus]
MNPSLKLTLVFSLLLPLFSGCVQAQSNTSPAYSQEQASFSQAQLDSLLAPIALYPDTLLSHILIASTYPLEVIQADRWVRNNKQLSGDAVVNAVEQQDWDPSVKALVAFPDVLKRMSEDLDWTQQLGDAFLADEARIMDSIQGLRNKAYASGNLDKMEHVKVVREERVITLEPTVERVVYVPVYDTRVVYGSWWWPDYPPVYWHYPSNYVYVSGFYWGPRVYIGSSFFFSGCHWRDRRVVVIDRHYHSHRFYNNRSIVHYRNSRHWHHNPVHRRGVAYYDNHTRERFHSAREPYQASRVYRTQYAQPTTGQRPHDNLNRPLTRPTDSLRAGSSPTQPGGDRVSGGGRVQNGQATETQRHAPNVNRVEQLRERMNNSAQQWRDNNPQRQVNRNNSASERAPAEQRLQRESNRETTTYRTGNITPTPRDNSSGYRRDIQQPQRIERTQERVEREQPRIERTPERIDRSQQQRVERTYQRESPTPRQFDRSGGSNNRPMREDRPIRGGREL